MFEKITEYKHYPLINPHILFTARRSYKTILFRE